MANCWYKIEDDIIVLRPDGFYVTSRSYSRNDMRSPFPIFWRVETRVTDDGYVCECPAFKGYVEKETFPGSGEVTEVRIGEGGMCRHVRRVIQTREFLDKQKGVASH